MGRAGQRESTAGLEWGDAMGNEQLPKKLTGAERMALLDWEQKIENGLKTFHEVGAALLEIKEEKLYRVTHETFEEYCRERWGFTRMYAHHLMVSSKTVASLNVNHGIQLPANERQARELAKVPEEERLAVWQQVLEETGGKPTAAAVRDVIERRKPRTCPNCGGTDFDGDGDCTSCFEPAAENPCGNSSTGVSGQSRDLTGKAKSGEEKSSHPIRSPQSRDLAGPPFAALLWTAIKQLWQAHPEVPAIAIHDLLEDIAVKVLNGDAAETHTEARP